MRCAHCGTRFDLEDNFCRRCGVALNRRDLPTVVSSSLLPIPWSMARGPVARGLVAVIVGTAVELARREVTRRVTNQDPSQALALLAAGRPAEARRSGPFPWSKPPKGEYEVTETVIQRSIRFFRK
ncbi:MAG: hypothetical protein ACYC66_05645 [Chloroflexota bacterium]